VSKQAEAAGKEALVETLVETCRNLLKKCSRIL